MREIKPLKTIVQGKLSNAGFKERYAENGKTETDLIIDSVKEWVKAQPTRAMIFEKSGLSIHLVSKRILLDELGCEK
jgi:hypothetical protein